MIYRSIDEAFRLRHESGKTQTLQNLLIEAQAEIERLRAERDDLMKANALLHALIGNREAEIERLRADKDVRSR